MEKVEVADLRKRFLWSFVLIHWGYFFDLVPVIFYNCLTDLMIWVYYEFNLEPLIILIKWLIDNWLIDTLLMFIYPNYKIVLFFRYFCLGMILLTTIIILVMEKNDNIFASIDGEEKQAFIWLISSLVGLLIGICLYSRYGDYGSVYFNENIIIWFGVVSFILYLYIYLFKKEINYRLFHISCLSSMIAFYSMILLLTLFGWSIW